MPLTLKQANKLKAGQTAWRCIPMVSRWGDGEIIVHVEEVLLQGKKTIGTDHAKGSFKFLGRSKAQFPYIKGGYYTSDLCGWSIAKAFLTRRKALKFKEQVEAGCLPDVVQETRERDADNRMWEESYRLYNDYDYDDAYDNSICCI